MEKKKNKALHWPIGIVLAILGIVALGIWTIMQANKYPVMEDDFYFQKYQSVEFNYYEILQKQKAFDKKYSFSYSLKKFSIGENTLVLNLTDKQGHGIDGAKLTIKITRPLSVDKDRFIKVTSQSNGNYNLEKFTVDQEGRWQILSKIEVGETISFTKTDVNATK